MSTPLPLSRADSGSDSPVPVTTPPKRWIRTPPIDIYESDDGLVLLADLPGVSPDALEVQVQDNKLTLFGRRADSIDETARVVHQEYPAADFLRSFILSEDVDHERISAHINDGVLEIRLPRAAKAAPRRIQVQTDRPAE